MKCPFFEVPFQKTNNNNNNNVWGSGRLRFDSVLFRAEM